MCGGGTSIVEYILSHLLFTSPGMDFHISTIMVSFGLFMLALAFPITKHFSLIRYVGKKLYMWIYLSHIFAGEVVDLLGKAFGWNTISVFTWVRPMVVLVLSCLIGILINEIVRIINNRQARLG